MTLSTFNRRESPLWQIVEFLQRKGSATIKEIEELLGVTTTAVRQHLTTLQAEGYIERRPVHSGVGRPHHAYFTTAKVQELFACHCDDLALTLLEEVFHLEGESRATRYGDHDESTARQPTTETARQSTRETPIPVVLTRYAAQTLYAPLRTVEPANGIVRVNLRRDLTLDTLLPTLPVRARALAAWRLEDQRVTAIRLTNTSARWIALDPRALQGDFLTATFQHPDLGPAGDAHDTTVVYLVTRGRSLAQSLLPVISPVDASLNLPAPNAAGHAQGAGHEE